MMAGDIVHMYKDIPSRVFSNNETNLYAIGLKPQQSVEDFQQMLNGAFRNDCKTEIGNIIFKVDSILGVLINKCKSKGVQIPDTIKALPSQQLKQTINKIAYK